MEDTSPSGYDPRAVLGTSVAAVLIVFIALALTGPSPLYLMVVMAFVVAALAIPFSIGRWVGYAKRGSEARRNATDPDATRRKLWRHATLAAGFGVIGIPAGLLLTLKGFASCFSIGPGSPPGCQESTFAFGALLTVVAIVGTLITSAVAGFQRGALSATRKPPEASL
jgi:hypothetical protein